ncbi:MAG: hypothetical protein O3B37_00715 [Proteobacteria bacterium]|nr:hypothetical protein [Pseudomonadota bacterium]
MDIALDLLRLTVALAAAAGILYGLYRGLRWRFPRLGAFRARLIVGLGAVFIFAIAMNRLTISDAQCLAHENTVLLRGERIINLRQAEIARPARSVDSPHYANVLESCAFLVEHCPLDGADKAGVTTARICEKAAAGMPLN